MKKYFTFIKRIITLEKYVLFRTVKFKMILFNIIFIGFLMTLPNIFTLITNVQIMSNLSNIDSEIPEFVIEDGTYKGGSNEITIDGHIIVFNESITQESISDLDHVDFAFIQDGFYISGLQNPLLDYTYISSINNKESLVEFIDTQSANIYFYVIMYFFLQLFLNMVFVIITLSIINSVFHTLSMFLNRKSRFMNWFKLSSFISVLFVIIIVVLYIFNIYAPWLYFLSLPFYYHYFKELPVIETTK